jgi:monofunctional biosynthetic peptidoglycan transglycosylase
MLKNIENRRFTRGGSSITQQLAKNLYLTPSRTIVRKLKEAVITYKLERELTKTRILEIYLNVIEWGENIYGAEEACRHYFNKTASELSLTEAIRLAVCVPNPRIYAPTGNSNGYLEGKQKQLLFTLWKHGWISRPKFMQTLNELDACQKAEYEPPVLIPFEKDYRQVDSPEFWIENMKDSEELLMSAVEIAAFNRRAGIIGEE